MTKRKHAAKSVTALAPSAPSARAISPNLRHFDASASPSAEKKVKISGGTAKAAVSVHAASEDLDIDDIFQQARNKKQAPAKTEKVCVLVAW